MKINEPLNNRDLWIIEADKGDLIIILIKSCIVSVRTVSHYVQQKILLLLKSAKSHKNGQKVSKKMP